MESIAKAGPIALLISDLDGTLLDRNKSLTDKAQAAVFKLYDAGIRFAITSARPPLGMHVLLEPLKIDLPLAGFNGGCIVTPQLTLIEEKTLPSAIVAEVIELVRKSQIDLWVYQGNHWYVSDMNARHVVREEAAVQIRPELWQDNIIQQITEVVKIVGVSDDPQAISNCQKVIYERFGKQVSCACSQTYYLDITHPLANKGHVVNFYAQYLSISPMTIATIGDMPTDALMFNVSGFSIAMGNASAVVQKQASYVTDSNENEGFAKAVERILLINKRFEEAKC